MIGSIDEYSCLDGSISCQWLQLSMTTDHLLLSRYTQNKLLLLSVTRSVRNDIDDRDIASSDMHNLSS